MPAKPRRNRQHSVRGASFVRLADDLDKEAEFHRNAAVGGDAGLENRVTAAALQKLADAMRREGKTVRHLR